MPGLGLPTFWLVDDCDSESVTEAFLSLSLYCTQSTVEPYGRTPSTVHGKDGGRSNLVNSDLVDGKSGHQKYHIRYFTVFFACDKSLSL